jgi:outer membrane receptor protein involved in Fe transport
MPFLAALIALMAAGSSFAQGIRGTIKGVVTDANGAAINGASVRLIDAAKKQEVRSLHTTETGAYQFIEIEPAVYEIVFSAPGFADRQITSIKVEPDRHLQLDVTLAVGAATGEVTVTTAGQELVDRQTPTLGTTVDVRRVVGLPLNGREVLGLALLQPGVTPAANNDPNGGDAFGIGLGLRVNGNRGVENNLTLDGSNNNEVAVGGATGASPRPDAVQEFRLLTSNFEAEFGRNTGSVINVVTKSGTNEFHGNARIFYRPTFISAARFFDKALPPADATPDTDLRRRFERKEFGGQLGGPLYMPRKIFGPLGGLNEGRDKLFFFIDYEGRRQLIGDTQVVTGLPTLAERAGDFSKLGRTLIDPATGRPFPGNQIPASLFSPIAKYYLQFLPIPDSTGSTVAGANRITNNNYVTARLDYLLNAKQTLNFTLNRFDSDVTAPFAFEGASVPGFGEADLDTTYNIVLRHTYALSPTLVNSLLLGYARNNQPSVAPQNTTTPAEIGFTADFVANPKFAGPPLIQFLQRGVALGNSVQGPQARVTENFQVQDSLSWVRGNHRLKFGFDGTFYKHDQLFVFINQGVLNFSRNTGSNTTGDDFADFLIGNSPSSDQFGSNGDRDFRQSAAALFAQDTWQLRPNLSLSLGVRWEYTSPLTDKFNRVAYYRAGAVSRLLTSGQLKSFEGIPIVVPPGGTAPKGLVYVGDPDPVLGGKVPAGGVAKDWNNFAPRIGIAYAPTFGNGALGKLFGTDRNTVIRAGFGYFYGAIIGDNVLQQLGAPGYSGTNAFYGAGVASGTLADPFAADPYPNFSPRASTPRNVPAVANPFLATQLEISAPLFSFPFAIDPHLRTPYIMQFNLTVERAFHNDYVLTLSYVGNRGHKLYAADAINAPLGTFFPAPLNYPIATTTNADDRRINLDIPISIDQTVSAGNSWYNAFQAQVQKRYSNGLLFQVAYTFSKSMNDSNTQRSELDLADRRAIRALSPDDIPHRVVASFIYDLPFAKRSGGAVRTLFGGWSFGGIYTYQSGTPFSILNPFDTIGTDGIIGYADRGAPFRTVDPRKNDRQAFNADAFQAFGDPSDPSFILARDFRRGTSGRNQSRAGNYINNFDLILSKKTKLWSESTALELRLEAFNTMNHTQFTVIDTNLLSDTFGKFTGARESRVVQLGARFSF